MFWIKHNIKTVTKEKPELYSTDINDNVMFKEVA